MVSVARSWRIYSVRPGIDELSSHRSTSYVYLGSRKITFILIFGGEVGASANVPGSYCEIHSPRYPQFILFYFRMHRPLAFQRQTQFAPNCIWNSKRHRCPFASVSFPTATFFSLFWWKFGAGKKDIEGL